MFFSELLCRLEIVAIAYGDALMRLEQSPQDVKLQNRVFALRARLVRLERQIDRYLEGPCPTESELN